MFHNQDKSRSFRIFKKCSSKNNNNNSNVDTVDALKNTSKIELISLCQESLRQM